MAATAFAITVAVEPVHRRNAATSMTKGAHKPDYIAQKCTALDAGAFGIDAFMPCSGAEKLDGFSS